jgi:hypothetical protein
MVGMIRMVMFGWSFLSGAPTTVLAGSVFVIVEILVVVLVGQALATSVILVLFLVLFFCGSMAVP